MNMIVKGRNSNVAVITSDNILVTDAQSALDLAMSISYDTKIHNIVLPKACIAEDFFKLSTGLLGEVLQKYINYHFRLAVVGDFSGYTSKPLHDFINESNKGKNFYFVTSESEAIERLGE